MCSETSIRWSSWAIILVALIKEGGCIGLVIRRDGVLPHRVTLVEVPLC